MTNYCRNYVPGGTYFFTLVSYRRRSIFKLPIARKSLREAISRVRKKYEFQIVALVLLPDHLHAVWTLPSGDDKYSMRWMRIKDKFTKLFLAQGGREGRLTASARRRKERGVWQRRYWEHTVRDEDDLERCVDYIHFNPVKQGYVTQVRDWPWSSFHRFVKEGQYSSEWGKSVSRQYDWTDFEEHDC